MTESSVKNFQLCMPESDAPDEVVLQFGRVAKHRFTMDFKYPLSPLQVPFSELTYLFFYSKQYHPSVYWGFRHLVFALPVWMARLRIVRATNTSANSLPARQPQLKTTMVAMDPQEVVKILLVDLVFYR